MEEKGEKEIELTTPPKIDTTSNTDVTTSEISKPSLDLSGEKKKVNTSGERLPIVSPRRGTALLLSRSGDSSPRKEKENGSAGPLPKEKEGSSTNEESDKVSATDSPRLVRSITTPRSLTRKEVSEKNLLRRASRGRLSKSL
jgi:hypothetical protein